MKGKEVIFKFHKDSEIELIKNQLQINNINL